MEDRSGHQFAVALFRSLEGESLEDYAHRLFKAWRIGAAKKDDGLLFVLFKDDRKWRVEVGYGLEPTLTDLEAAELARAGIPYFKEGYFDGGVETVVEGLARVVEGTDPRPKTPVSDDTARFVIVVIVVLYLLLQLRRRRGSTFRSSGGWYYGGGWGGGGGGWSGGGGFSGGGGSSGGGGASGGW